MELDYILKDLLYHLYPPTIIESLAFIILLIVIFITVLFIAYSIKHPVRLWGLKIFILGMLTCAIIDMVVKYQREERDNINKRIKILEQDPKAYEKFLQLKESYEYIRSYKEFKDEK